MTRRELPDFTPNWRSSMNYRPPKPSRLGEAVWRWAPVTLWAGAVFWVTSVQEWGAALEGGVDKLGHLGAYMVLALLMNRALFRGQKRQRLAINGPLVVLVCMGVGLAGEWYQESVPGRGFEWGDLGANLVGTLVGIGLLLPWYKQARYPRAE